MGGLLTAVSLYLTVRSGKRCCGLPLAQVIEVFRPLPIESRGDVPSFVLGLTRVRGGTATVVDLRLLLGDAPPVGQADGRYVSLRVPVDERRIVLAVDAVMGLREVPIAFVFVEDLPPMLVPGNPAMEALATFDRSLMCLLRTACMFPP